MKASQSLQVLPEYFAPLLPWQQGAWAQVTKQYQTAHLPHALLAAGMAGVGKRAFVWRMVAYLLCHHKHSDGACGQCDSCTWLKAGTHPDVHLLPDEGAGSIKIDEIRALQDVVHLKSTQARVVVLDNAETLTLAAANALLKTLEEPSDGVYFVLISDSPTQLLPTIKSRVQTLPLLPIESACAIEFVMTQLAITHDKAMLLLTLADFAPLVAVRIPHTSWFDKRALWLKTYKALQLGTRTPMAASSYWQDVLSLEEFMILSRMMLLELWRLGLGLPSVHSDIDGADILSGVPLSATKLTQLLAMIEDISQATHQNVQDKISFDALMVALSR